MDIKLGAKVPCEKCGLPIRPGTFCPICETFGMSVSELAEWRKQEEEQRKRLNKMGTWPVNYGEVK